MIMTEPSKNLYNFSFALLLASGLIACHGANIDEFTSIAQPTSQTISGRTADGYLVNANVCLDLNLNLLCDQKEPVTLSKQGGEYLIEGIAPEIDLTKARVIVEVLLDVTIDEDNPNKITENSYTLTSPPGQSDFISPITTIVDTVMKNDRRLTIDEAQRMVKQHLGITNESDVNLFVDYVAASGESVKSTTKNDYARLRIVAQVVTNAFAENMSYAAYTNPYLVDDQNFNATHNVVISHLKDSLNDLVGVIDSVIVATKEGENITNAVLNSDVVLFVAEEAQLNVADIVKRI
jgi:hypothetical protein